LSLFPGLAAKFFGRFSKPEKGKPLEKVGRKATDLSPQKDMVAGLPGEYSTSQPVFARQDKEGGC